MATYRSQLITVPSPEPQGYAASLRVTERPVYGSSRLGTYARCEELYDHPVVSTPTPDPVQPVDLNYELTDHLGNVTAVVTGRLLNGNGGGTPKQAELVSAQGYEAFGSLLPGRSYSSSTYAYGFNGMRKDDEVHGATGTSYDFGARLYDPRVGRWLSLDALAGRYASLSPYAFVRNNPIYFVDPDGRLISVSGASPEMIEAYRTMLVAAFAGKITVEVIDGVVSIHQVPETIFTEYELNAFEIVKEVEKAPQTINVQLVNNETTNAPRVDSYDTGELNIDGLAVHGTNDDEVTTKAMYVHYLVEQLDKSERAEAGEDMTTLDSYSLPHERALRSENFCNRLNRFNDAEYDYSWGVIYGEGDEPNQYFEINERLDEKGMLAGYDYRQVEKVDPKARRARDEAAFKEKQAAPDPKR